MERPTFWSRVEHWFKPGNSQSLLDPPLPQTGADGLLKNEYSPVAGNGASRSRVFRRPSQGQAINRLEDGYGKISTVVDSIHKHLEIQDERSRQVADSLSQLARTVAELPDAARSQHQELANLAQHFEVSNARLARWETTVSEIPKLANAQQETLRSLTEQIESNRKTHEQIAVSLEGFAQAANTLGSAFQTSVETLAEVQRSTANRDDRLTELLEEQNRKFTKLFVGAIVLAGTLGVTTLVMSIVN